jgi:hypothetical protein
MPRVDLAAGFPQPAYEAAHGLHLVAKSAVPGAEVAVRQAVSQHMVAGPEHGSDPGEDRLLVAASGLDAEESCLGLGLGAHASPRSGDQRGLEPRCAVVHVGGAAPPGTLVVFRVKGQPTTGDALPRAPPGSASANYRWSVNTMGRDVPPQRLDRGGLLLAGGA